jgi:hypothetical protein
MNPSASLDRALLGREIGRELKQRIDASAELAGLLKRLSAQGRVVVFGGFVRDRIHGLIHGKTTPSRDLDLVVDGILGPAFESVSRNNFGGSRMLAESGLKIDYWELRRTYAFSRGWFEATLENLPRTTVYSVNACCFDGEKFHLLEHGAIAGIAEKSIAFNCREYLDVFPDYQAFRGIELARRMGYGLAPEVLSFVADRLRRAPKAEFLRAVRQHRADVSEAEIEELCRPYCDGAGYAPPAAPAGEAEWSNSSSG